MYHVLVVVDALIGFNCGWQFDCEGALRNIMQNLTISSNVNVYPFIISVQTSITKTCKIPFGCKPFETIHNQMRCPCSIQFLSAFDSMIYESKKERKQRMVASLVVMFFFPTFWQGINPSQRFPPKIRCCKSLELCTSFLFFLRSKTEEPWNQRFCRQNPRNPRHLVLEHMVVNGWGGRGRTGGVYWVGPWQQNIVFHMR